MTITFQPMDEEQFNAYYATKLHAYAREHVKAGNWDKGEALEKAEKQFKLLLPEGVETEDHHLFIIKNDDESIGTIWLYVKQTGQDKQAFIYDVELDENQRGKGYGTRTMAALEEYAKSQSISRIGLHVFAHNERALKLYQKMGYETKSYQMSKTIFF
ncbi:Protein N-acetyltransferase, RimJ/RimL family [Lentibacillus persicus]|uniref:Protein N-acetyltransferase, RimJ/RimL family n=1 Tax=Lentibacillus persicus TaxID=640948 RepID=A0A1I1S201_9BACI|nr:GNAT family N-acetyltransferase [Lentibacillus persicus]SFD40565.1 Protein N-acetyltransferase, RimJ/RimL family [Lentibacillus persicus]